MELVGGEVGRGEVGRAGEDGVVAGEVVAGNVEHLDRRKARVGRNHAGELVGAEAEILQQRKAEQPVRNRPLKVVDGEIEPFEPIQSGQGVGDGASQASVTKNQSDHPSAGDRRRAADDAEPIAAT